MLMSDNFKELRERMIKATKGDIKEAYGNEEYILMQAINAYNETTRTHNLMYERLSEWFGIYFPEVRLTNPLTLGKLSTLAILITKAKDLKKDDIQDIVEDEEIAESIYNKVTNSMGRKLEYQEEYEAISGFGSMLNNVAKGMDELDKYIKAAANRILPNVTFLTDDKIAAELLAKAGSLERLSTMPASTIQLLGAEKALFKHIKFGSKPPKYGIIFKLPAVTAAQREKKGMVARAYATKICIALKADYFSKKFIADKLKESLEENLAKITEKEVAPKQYQTFNDRGRRPGGFRPQGGGKRGGGGFQRKGKSGGFKGNRKDKPRSGGGNPPQPSW